MLLDIRFNVKILVCNDGEHAFVTHKGVFQFKVLPFGLSNASATFNRIDLWGMSRLLKLAAAIIKTD